MSLLLLCACQKESVEVAKAKDPLEEAYQLIDQGDYSQAIQELQELSLKDLRPSVRVAWASAYAARGGIRVEDYWGFVIGFAAPLGPAQQLMQAPTVWEQYKERLDAIPAVNGVALMDLKRAVQILAKVQTPGGRLYRAILNLILFKSYITASADFWRDHNLDYNKIIEQVLMGDTQVLCQFNADELLKWLNPIFFHLIETLEDLSVAFPENRKDFEPARELIQNAMEELHKKRSCP